MKNTFFRNMFFLMTAIVVLSLAIIVYMGINKTINNTSTFKLVAGITFLIVFILIKIAIAIYVYKDAKRYSINEWFWVLISVYIPSFIGFILYLAMTRFGNKNSF